MALGFAVQNLMQGMRQLISFHSQTDIVLLCHCIPISHKINRNFQLQAINQNCIDTAFDLFSLALNL